MDNYQWSIDEINKLVAELMEMPSRIFTVGDIIRIQDIRSMDKRGPVAVEIRRELDAMVRSKHRLMETDRGLTWMSLFHGLKSRLSGN